MARLLLLLAVLTVALIPKVLSGRVSLRRQAPKDLVQDTAVLVPPSATQLCSQSIAAAFQHIMQPTGTPDRYESDVFSLCRCTDTRDRWDGSARWNAILVSHSIDVAIDLHGLFHETGSSLRELRHMLPRCISLDGGFLVAGEYTIKQQNLATGESFTQTFTVRRGQRGMNVSRLSGQLFGHDRPASGMVRGMVFTDHSSKDHEVSLLPLAAVLAVLAVLAAVLRTTVWSTNSTDERVRTTAAMACMVQTTALPIPTADLKPKRCRKTCGAKRRRASSKNAPTKATSAMACMDDVAPLTEAAPCELVSQVAQVSAPEDQGALVSGQSHWQSPDQDFDCTQKRLAAPTLSTIPCELICPITLEIFNQPVIVSDGHTYELDAIKEWMLRYGTSPKTREPLSDNIVIPNLQIRQLVQAYCATEDEQCSLASTPICVVADLHD